MNVAAVEVSILERDSYHGSAMGHVVFHAGTESDADFVHFQCSTECAPEASENALRRALAAEAKRQMLRMPEYRNGAYELVFLDGCEPLMPR